MDTLLTAFDRALSLLPFNGKKTEISLVLKGLLPLLAFIPGLNVVAASVAVNAVVDAALAASAAHAAVKHALGKD